MHRGAKLFPSNEKIFKTRINYFWPHCACKIFLAQTNKPYILIVYFSPPKHFKINLSIKSECLFNHIVVRRLRYNLLLKLGLSKH